MVVLVDFWLEIFPHFTVFRLSIASAADGGGLKPPMVVDGEFLIVTTLECAVNCKFAGGGRVSAVFPSLSLEFRFQVTSFRLWIASASDGGGSKPPVGSAGGNVAAVIVADEQTVHVACT